MNDIAYTPASVVGLLANTCIADTRDIVEALAAL